MVVEGGSWDLGVGCRRTGTAASASHCLSVALGGPSAPVEGRTEEGRQGWEGRVLGR